jgi:pyruvate carboxylase
MTITASLERTTAERYPRLIRAIKRNGGYWSHTQAVAIVERHDAREIGYAIQCRHDAKRDPSDVYIPQPGEATSHVTVVK